MTEVEIKPNLFKVLIYYIIQLILFGLIFFGFFIMIDLIVGFEIFDEVFIILGARAVSTHIYSTLLNLFVIIAFIYLTYNIIMNMSRIKVSEISIETTKLKERTISYSNLVSVSYSQKKFLSKMLNFGQLNLGLTGLSKDNIFFEFIDNPEEITKKIQEYLTLSRTPKDTYGVSPASIQITRQNPYSAENNPFMRL